MKFHADQKVLHGYLASWDLDVDVDESGGGKSVGARVLKF